MFQSREEIRGIYLAVWRKLNAGSILQPMESIIADIIQMHPEYHALLDAGETTIEQDFNADQGQGNPFMHMGMHIAIREQVSIDRPASIRALHESLCRKVDVHEAEHAIIECLGQALWKAQHNNAAVDEQEYLECVRKI